MPGRDRTGPEGLGAMSGRGAGFCAGSSARGKMSGASVRGRGGGHGRRNRFFATGLPGWMRAGFGHQPTAVGEERELAGLKRQAQLLQNSLKEIGERMEQLENEDKK